MTDTNLSPEELQTRLEAEIELQRAQLADTVDQLSHKLDVKAQARARLQRVGPQHVAAFVGAAVVVGVLVWWRRR
jgi:negative regulator of sigma E activity